MPLYKLKCLSCDNEYDKLVTSYTPDGWLCPKCGGRTEQVVGNSSFVLAGSGWAKDGYQ